jgi:hypothetical protein
VDGDDAAGEHVFEHGQRLARDFAQRGDAVDDLRLDLFGQAMEHGGGHVRVDLDEQDGNRLRMLGLDQRDQHLRGKPAREFERGGPGASGAMRCIRLSAFTSPTARVINSRTAPRDHGRAGPAVRSARRTRQSSA